MIPVKAIFNKLKIYKKTFVIIFVVVPVVAVMAVGIAGSVYFYLTSKKLSAQLAQKDQETKASTESFQNTNREYLDLKGRYDTIQRENADYQEKYKALEIYRDKLGAQVKSLIRDRERARTLEEKIGEVNKTLDASELEKKEFFDKTLLQKEQINDLEIIQKQILQEKSLLEDILTQERSKSNYKKIEQENLFARKENSDLSNNLRKAQAELGTLRASENLLKESERKLKEQVLALNDKVRDFESKFNEQHKKNALLEKKTRVLPKKMAELARQNKALIKQTANTHYNLGVYYTKQKEYGRAVTEFEKTIELMPNDAYAHFNLGYIYAEHYVNRTKAMKHFQLYLKNAKKEDKDVDWVRKYLITWQTYGGKQHVN
ncbi:MAG: tetratricopeptide repeat protein [Candidatus Omnitrophica bacterium]|nr:tetratricopeptide repeat protein [Candidatus Omnitrophota bacterium]